MKIITKREETGKLRVVTMPEGASLTQEQFKDDCDANKIINKYKKTRQITHLRASQGVYADLSELEDYQTMLGHVQKAEMAMMALPPALRNKFNGNPADMIAYLQDPANYEESVALGLREKPTAAPAAPTPDPKS